MRRNWLIPILIFFAIIALVGQDLRGGPEITPQETAKLLTGEPRPVLIDLRDRAEYEQGHLPGALSVPFAEFKGRVESLNLPKADAVVLYSNDDARTREATKHLYQSGYQGGLTLKGGIEGWRAAGQALQKPPPAAKP